MTELITSPQNTRLKLVRRLESRRGRMAEGAFAVEGEDLVLAGLQAGWPLRYALVDAEAIPDVAVMDALTGRVVSAVPSKLLAAISAMAHPPRVIGVFDLPDAVTFDNAAVTERMPSIFLDGLRDPGNVGTVIRTSAALGVTRVVIGPGTADPFSPKASRASMGAIFTVPVSEAGSIADAAHDGQQVVALDSDGGVPIWEADLQPGCLITLGSERSGVSDEVRARADVRVTIPQSSEIESMNAGVAVSIALYDLARRRAGASS